MKKTLLFFLAAFAFQLLQAQPSTAVNLSSAPKPADLAAHSIEFKYAGEFKLPSNEIQIRWKIIGTFKNVGGQTFKPGSGYSRLVCIADDQTSQMFNNVKAFISNDFSLAPGATTTIESEIRYIKGTPNPTVVVRYMKDYVPAEDNDSMEKVVPNFKK